MKAYFVVPKKAVKLATRRNRIKRLLREAWRINKDKIKPTDVVIIRAYKDINTLKEAEELLSSFLSKKKLLK